MTSRTDRTNLKSDMNSHEIIKNPQTSQKAEETLKKKKILSLEDELASMPRNKACEVYFPLNTRKNKFEHMAFDEKYFWGIVRQKEVEELVRDVNDYNAKHPKACDKLIWVIGLVLLSMFASLFLLFIYRQQTLNQTSVDPTTGEATSQSSPTISTGWLIAIGLGVLAVGTLIITCLCACMKRRAIQSQQEHRLGIVEILHKHQNSVFGDRSVKLEISDAGAFISLKYIKPQSKSVVKEVREVGPAAGDDDEEWNVHKDCGIDDDHKMIDPTVHLKQIQLKPQLPSFR